VVGRRFALGAVLALATAKAVTAAPPSPYADHVFATAVPHSDADVREIWRASQHVLEPHDPRLAPHTLLITKTTLARLRARGVDVSALPLDVEASLAPAPVLAQAAGRLGIFGAWFGQVQDLPAIYDYLDELARASNGRAQVIVVGTSVEGRELRALRIGSGNGRASVLVTGTQHAREWASPMVTMGFADALVRRGQAPQLRAITDAVDVYVLPVVNADGYVASHHGWRMQRKNMNPRCGVDLNRNFDIAFGMGSIEGGCGDENYPGTGAFSEPETQAIKRLAESLSNLRLFLDYHAPAEQVMIPFAHTRERPAGYQKSVAWAQLYSDTLKSLYGTLHPAREGYDLAQGQGGGAIDWFRVKFGESFSVELRDGRELSGFQLPVEQLVPTVEEN
jgi:murein tripeptide amidase MpaA